MCTAAAGATASGWRQRACAPKGRQRGWRRHSRRAVRRRGELEAHRPGRLLRRHHRWRHHRWRHHCWRRSLWGLLRRAALVLLSACTNQSINSRTSLWFSTSAAAYRQTYRLAVGCLASRPQGCPPCRRSPSRCSRGRPWPTALCSAALRVSNCDRGASVHTPAHPRTTPAHPHKGHGRQRARRGALLDDEAVHLVAVHAQAGRAGEALVAVRALEVLGLLVLDERGLVRKLAVAVKAPGLHLLLLFLLAHHCGPRADGALTAARSPVPCRNILFCFGKQRCRTFAAERALEHQERQRRDLLRSMQAERLLLSGGVRSSTGKHTRSY